MNVTYRRALRLIALTTFGIGCSLQALATPVDDAQAMLQQGNPTAALSLLDRYLENSPQDAEARFARGLVLVRLNRTTDAIHAFADLTRDYPQLPEPYNNLAVLYAQQGNYEKARDALEAALATHPAYATAHENLGDIYAALAGAAYNKALSLDEANNVVRYKLSLLSQLSNTSETSTQVASAATGRAVRPVESPLVVSTGSTAAVKEGPVTMDREHMSAPVPATASTLNIASNAPASSTTSTANVSTSAAASSAAASSSTASTAVAAAASTAAATPAAVRPGLIDPAAVMVMVDAWANAWSNHDVDSYLSFYAPNFVPEGGLTRDAWEAQRRQRVGKAATIAVELSDKQVDVVDTTHLRVSFLQHYQSGTLNDRVHKVLEWVQADGQWKIGREFITAR